MAHQANDPPPRFKRPDLERREPIRRWTGVFGGPRASVPSPSPGAGYEQPAVQRGVDTGYRVLDEYLRQGQSFARSFSGARPFAEQSAGGPQLAEQLARTTLDWLATWFDYMQNASHVSRPRSGAAPEVGAFDIEPRAAASVHEPAREVTKTNGHSRGAHEAPLISLDVSSKQRTEVTIDLKSDSLTYCLTTHDLRAADPDLPRIQGVSIETDVMHNRVRVSLSVPDDQRPAVYSGLIIDDATHLPRGSLTVRVIAREET